MEKKGLYVHCVHRSSTPSIFRPKGARLPICRCVASKLKTYDESIADLFLIIFWIVVQDRQPTARIIIFLYIVLAYMCPVLARVPWTVAESFDNEYTCIADVTRALVAIRDPKTWLKQ